MKVIKWAGGKQKLLSKIKFPSNYVTYHEPFLGGAAVFEYLAPKKAYLSDLNADLINMWLCVKNNPDYLNAILAIHKHRHNSNYYYKVRDAVHLNPYDRAAQFIYLNATCFNGLYRVNKAGKFNVPIGSYVNPAIYKPLAVCAMAGKLQWAELQSTSYDAYLTSKLFDETDFIYLDPPYDAAFTSYTAKGFKEKDQIKLSLLFRDLADKGVKLVLSNADTPFIRALYEGFTIENVSLTHTMRHTKAKELIVYANPD